ncbi:MAG: hypothetical protein OdinLCB4_002300 [Candidatus Odinarchaeum yellowstonii]|uniref:UDP-N-acetylglucosamine transferase subunit ALG14 n=1 Tax=Odinarchaeota yellowstonii (strain LCB_4) TaxID=1841599 RepID=A0AAF0D3J0_ODILC|nr:MAG: hypothetical protein OdinLCB4_002300 [Candidatus Odinarchaeum yellowstonii]
MVVLGGGGHSFEMIKILENIHLKDNLIFVLNHDDHYTPVKRNGSRVYRLLRPRKPLEYGVKTFFRFILSFLNALFLLIWTRPKIILTNGPSISVPLTIIGWLLRARIIFVESICRVYRLSLSGRLLLPLINLFIVQWPYLKKYSSKIIYGGRIF